MKKNKNNSVVEKTELPSISISGKDAKNIYKAINLLKENGFKKKLHSLVKEAKEEWVATSVEYETNSSKKWHCHGQGKTPSSAVKEMIFKIKKYKNDLHRKKK